MQEITLMWIMLVAGSFVSGVCTVAILVTRRSAERLIAVVGITAFLLAAWSFAGLSGSYERIDAVLYAIVFAVGAGFGGYALASTLLGTLARHPHAQVELHALPEDNGSAVLVILGDDEPREYDERATATALDHLADEGLLHASIPVLPFLFMAQKARYRAIGGTSGSARQLDDLAERIESSLVSTPFTAIGAASLNGTRNLEEAVLDAIGKGFRRIVVAATMVGESLELDQSKRRVDALRLAEKGVHIAYTDALADSDRVASLVASRIMLVADEPATTGVVLVGAGQPETRSRECRNFDEQEAAFLNRVRMHIIDRGLSDSRIRIAWSDWRAPDVTMASRHLAALGCLRIVVSPTCFPLDTLQSTLDIQIALRQARLDPGISAVTLTGYVADQAFAEEIRGRALKALDTLPV